MQIKLFTIFCLLAITFMPLGMAFFQNPPEGTVQSVLYGVVEELSTMPDPGRNDYPNCLYAVKVKVHSSEPALGDDHVIAVIPILKNSSLLKSNVLAKGDKVKLTLIGYNVLPQTVKEIQISDDIMDFERDYFYCLSVTKGVTFTAEADPDASRSDFTLHIPQIPFNAEFPASRLRRRQMIEESLARCRHALSLIKEDTWYARRKQYYQLVEKRHAEWVNNCFFAADGAVHQSSNTQQTDFIERLAEYNKFLQKHNIDLILVRIPGKGDMAEAFFANPNEYMPNPDWLKFQIACLSNDIEVIDPLPEMWKRRFDYPLFYFYHEYKESHPLTGTSYITAEILSGVLRRYEDGAESKKLYILQTGQYAENMHKKYYYPAGNNLYPADTAIQFPAVLEALSGKVPEFAPDTVSKYIFLSNSFAAYPQRKSGGSIPHYLAYIMNKPMAWFYRDGVGNIMLRTLLMHPEYLKDRRAVIMVMHPSQWLDMFPALPKYYQLDVESLQRFAVLNPAELSKMIDNAHTSFFKLAENDLLQVLPLEGTRGGMLHLRSEAKNIMLRIHLTTHSYLTVEVLDKSGNVIDTASLPRGENDHMDLIFTNTDGEFTLSFKNTGDRKITSISRIELFSW